MLVDTLCGMNIAEYCKELTNLPIRAANTHGHFDHAAGNFVFSEVYIHPNDIEMMYNMSTIAMREEYVRSQNKKHNESLKWDLQDVAEVKFTNSKSCI